MNQTLPRMVLQKAEERRQKTALRHKDNGSYQDITWRELGQNIRAFGLGLLNLGLQKGERVAIMAPNSPFWAYSDLGTMSVGGFSVPVYHTEGLPALLHMLSDSGSRFLFLHSPLSAEELLEHLEEVPNLERIILQAGSVDHDRVISLESFLEGAGAIPEADLELRLGEGIPDEVATIVYTSGTTGPPKGVILTHNNFLSNIEACSGLFEVGESDECLSFLPLAHVFERMAGYYFMLSGGAVISYAESIDTVPVNMEEIRPTIMTSVPRLYEKMYARVMERILSGTWLKKQVFFAALKACRTCLRQELSGQRPNPLLARVASFARRRIFSKLRERLGGRLRFFISGGAPLGRDVAEFFLAAGIPIYEGYGLTETSPVIAANTPEALRLGTVGRPIPGTEVRIAEDGEILVKGPGVFTGYWERPQETEKAFDGEWFRTGDVGTIDKEGFLAITDRKKDLIVTAGGENIAPQNLENLFKSDKFIANAMVYGDRKPYLTALLVPNLENIEAHARRLDLDFLNHCDLVNHPKVLELLRQRVDRLQQDMPEIQKVKRFTLLSQDFAREDMTPTMKLKRKKVTKRFHEVLESMYLPKGHGIHDNGLCIADGEEE